jgi:hypothetical protein
MELLLVSFLSNGRYAMLILIFRLLFFQAVLVSFAVISCIDFLSIYGGKDVYIHIIAFRYYSDVVVVLVVGNGVACLVAKSTALLG